MLFSGFAVIRYGFGMLRDTEKQYFIRYTPRGLVVHADSHGPRRESVNAITDPAKTKIIFRKTRPRSGRADVTDVPPRRVTATAVLIVVSDAVRLGVVRPAKGGASSCALESR